MLLISIQDALLAFGERPLLDGAELAVHRGERLGLIGRNGTGKSTLLGVIAGRLSLDEGGVQRAEGLRLALVEQEPLLPDAPTLRESLLARAAAQGAPLDWQLLPRLNAVMHKLGIPGDLTPAAASGGERKRATLALALTLEVDLLLLDEPTNHLDIGAIQQLEELLAKLPALIVVTHDRAFLDATTNRIVELDRGRLRSYPGNFAAYERRREQELAAEDTARRIFERFWAQEEVWIRRGIEARRTRNEGRVRRLEQLRSERAARRDRIGALRMRLDAGNASGELVAELSEVGKSFGRRQIIAALSMRIMRGDRLGLIGPNGAGKSTLLRLLLGQLAPDQGSVRLGTNLRIAYFDQLREQLVPDATLAEMISPGSDWIQIGAERRHVIGYLGDFLFSAARAQAPVRMLSGGERNRLLLARLFAQPANLLVLDEPTNDLDIESLELLEQRLQDYAGTLLLVSHDRRFLDNVVTQVLVAEGGGQWREYAGGYSDWQRLRAAQPLSTGGAVAASRPDTQGTRDPAVNRSSRRLSWREQRELEALPQEIEALEREQTDISQRMSAGDYWNDVQRARADSERLGHIQALLADKFARWETLEAQHGLET
ncbi:MAG TPA: ATP-binding cassette domain-containing protein [Steroidobacteraceae bacterium]|jgi:ATP-binding cassette subfamily F protein uup|nr:ATP-binding cassette domain-containing protein [Steroidobacteraceae bacterium]